MSESGTEELRDHPSYCHYHGGYACTCGHSDRLLEAKIQKERRVLGDLVEAAENVTQSDEWLLENRGNVHAVANKRLLNLNEAIRAARRLLDGK